MAVERIGKDLFADRLRLLDGLVLEAVGLPGRGVAFDQERAHVGRIAVMMRVERSEIGLHEGLRQRGKTLAGAVPGELVGRMRDRGAEFLLETAAHQRVQPVGGDDQVVAPEFVERLDDGVVSRRDAGGADALLQDRQQFEPADRGEADAVDLDALAAQIERDVLPAFHPRRDRIDRLGIVGAQEFQRLFGEHDAKAPGRALGVLFEQVDLGVGMTPLPEIGEVEASGASADHGDTHGLPPRSTVYLLFEATLNRTGERRYRKICRNRASGRLGAPLPLAGEVGSHRRCDPGGGSLRMTTLRIDPHPNPPPQAGEGAHRFAAHNHA